MPELNYDLHIHSCLSPCGDDDMTPANIVGMAMIKGLDLIAVTDHNSCKNCPAVLTMADAYGLTALPGMELTTSEEVHVVCLFADLKDALAFDEYVYSRLMPIPNNEKIFGKQQLYNADNLGFIPPDSRFTCVEIKDMTHYHALKKQHPYLEHCRIISDSDAHYLEHINEPHYTLSVKSRNPKDILSALTTAV